MRYLERIEEPQVIYSHNILSLKMDVNVKIIMYCMSQRLFEKQELIDAIVLFQ